MYQCLPIRPVSYTHLDVYKRQLHGYDTFHGNGLRFQWRDEDGEVEGYVSWKDIEKDLGVLIITWAHQPETPRIDELAMDGFREDDEVIDAEYQEVEPEEAESEIDDYAKMCIRDRYNTNIHEKIAEQKKKEAMS